MDHLVGLFDPGSDEAEIPSVLPPEARKAVEEGNVEYKLKLVNPSESRFEHLVTQMKWRLEEGQGEAFYEIGVEDCGLLTGLTEEDMDASLYTLHRMSQQLGASITILREKEVATGKKTPRQVAEVLVKKIPENQQFLDLRLAVLGNVDAGKSTLLGVLTQGELDNGRGRARLNLFRHLHEIQSGRSSSISHEILGFDSEGELVNYSESRTVEDILDCSTKIITLIDLCGHQKYMKTTIFGLTGHSPDFAMVVVSANSGVVGTTREHLGFALALGVPFFVVVSKVDMCRPIQVERTMKQLERLLKGPGCKRMPFRIHTEADAVAAGDNFHGDSVCPIFTVSSVSGKNLPLLVKFLNVLPPLLSTQEWEQFANDSAEHQIDEVFSISGVGTVVGGTLLRGSVRQGDQLLLGPSDSGEFQPVRISTIHRNRVPCAFATAGQTACLSLSGIDQWSVRKGMVLLSAQLSPVACLEFEADVYLLFHSNFICKGFQTVIHVGNVRQTASIVKMNKNSLETNEKAVVTFRFLCRPEYIRVGSRLLLREGRTKGMGEVTKVIAM
ncbi:hypothetical protein CAPTEDRAFT_18841 [Capitella teleta]|uniref:Tr-type G domain-containing protein n=1 Tax=Capitella teleta TaxID=283909 RepID=R7U0H3_CAPTE|nr:hypothetical protein CAPTEDRAFT_18841 [Capitella teleta]|eukprot:ELT99327.1 hypothetical protein CAPTEDRAFT_18841 [Capitella teleta]